MDPLSAQAHFAGAKSDGARDDLAERRLAGSVLTDQSVDGTTGDRDRHPIERANAVVVMGDIEKLYVRGLGGTLSGQVRARLPGCQLGVRRHRGATAQVTPIAIPISQVLPFNQYY